MSRFLTLSVDSGPRGFEFVHLGVDFGPFGVDFDLCESILGRWVSIVGTYTKIDFGPLEVDF